MDSLVGVFGPQANLLGCTFLLSYPISCHSLPCLLCPSPLAFPRSICGMWKFLGHGSNLSCTCHLHHRFGSTGSLTHCAGRGGQTCAARDNARSLTCCTTVGTPPAFWLFLLECVKFFPRKGLHFCRLCLLECPCSHHLVPHSHIAQSLRAASCNDLDLIFPVLLAIALLL